MPEDWVKLLMAVGRGATEALALMVDQMESAGLKANADTLAAVQKAIDACGTLESAAQKLKEDLGLLISGVGDAVTFELVGAGADGSQAAQGCAVAAGVGPGGARKPEESVATARAPTDEQLAVEQCEAHEITVTAMAGSGKTTTCIGYARARQKRRFLYVAFNKSVQMEASRRFPANVECKTSHGIAFPMFGSKYANARKLNNPRAREVMEFLDARVRMPVGTADEKYHLSQLVLRRVLDFLQAGSLDREIGKKGTAEHYTLLSQLRVPGETVAEYANMVWAAMQDLNCLDVSMPHDGYLKLYALSRPVLSRYDGIILDESQDTNMAVFGFVGRQETGKLMVGDMHQSIYQFRGAVNVMDKLRDAQRLTLTKSFRFGQDVADVANSILGVFCEEKLKIKGCGVWGGKGDNAHLYRTNAGLFGGVVGWMEANAKTGAGMHLVGGYEGYGLDLIKDTWSLKCGQHSSMGDVFLRKFKTYDQLCEYAEAVDDKELKARVKIVDQYGQRIPELVERVKATNVPADRAAMQATTAHKSKGLEWSTVVLGDDFPDLMSEGGLPRHTAFVGKDGEPLERQECNLYYVASTRAQANLVPNQSLREFMLWCKNNVDQIGGQQERRGR
jgi:hypothetical protein